jgi:hypothetical protein
MVMPSYFSSLSMFNAKKPSPHHHDHDMQGKTILAFRRIVPYKRFNDPVQGFGAEHVLWNDHRQPSPGGERRPALMGLVH